MKVYLEGMGVLGSFLAWELRDRGIDFAWYDAETQTCAWPACTGAVYPSGDPLEREAHRIWRAWLNHRGIGPHASVATWWYSTKAPPFGAPGREVEQVGRMRRSVEPSFHLNAQSFVQATRLAFLSQKLEWAPEPRSRTVRIVGHGFSDRLDHYIWGWSRKVRLDGLLTGSGDHAFYVHENRFSHGYAYPVPGELGWWYAGSSMVSQRQPGLGNPELAYWRWRKMFESISGQRVMGERPVVVGWRPAPAAKYATGFATTREISGQRTILVKPMGASGVRMAPLVVSAVMNSLVSP